MAEKLKRDYDLIVLKTELRDDDAGQTAVSFTLQYKVKGILEDGRVWSATPESIGIDKLADNRALLGGGPPLQLPTQMLDDLVAWFREESDGNRALWVHLVRPYGALCLVPWERILGRALGVPIVMLPDFLFPPPLETEEELDVVVCGSAPLGHEQHSVLNGVQRAVEQMLDATGRRMHVHVFTDSDIASWLQQNWAGMPSITSRITIYDAKTAASFVTDDIPTRPLENANTLRSPWLLWMQEMLGGRAVDVAHFVCHGYMTRGRGALLFAQSPIERTDRFLAGPVGSPELQTFLNQVGAWSTTFTSLQDNYCEPGVRALADQIAQSRPGPLLMASVREDPHYEAFRTAYRFLYAPTRSPVPNSPALFMYCQPYLVGSANEPVVRKGVTRSVGVALPARNPLQASIADRSLVGSSALDQVFTSQPRVASWVAATERFAEQVHIRYQQLTRDEVASVQRAKHDSTIALDTVDRLRNFAARRATTSGKSNDTP